MATNSASIKLWKIDQNLLPKKKSDSNPVASSSQQPRDEVYFEKVDGNYSLDI
jgi:hypothetical protein